MWLRLVTESKFTRLLTTSRNVLSDLENGLRLMGWIDLFFLLLETFAFIRRFYIGPQNSNSIFVGL